MVSCTRASVMCEYVIRLVCGGVSSEVTNGYICRNRPWDVSVSVGGGGGGGVLWWNGAEVWYIHRMIVGKN